MSDVTRTLPGTLPAYPDPAAAGAPGAPGATTDAAAEADAAARMAALFGMGPTGPGAAEAKNKYAAQGAAPLPPPPGPRAAITAQTPQAYASLQQEMQQVFGQAQAATPRAPWTSGPRVDPTQDPEGAAAQIGDWLAQTVTSLDHAQGNLLLAFMKLRLQGDSEGMRALESLSDNASAMQRQLMKAQDAHIQASQQAAEKAQNKAGKADLFSKIFTVVMAVVTAITAVLTLGLTLPLLAVAAAGAVAFVMASTINQGGKFNAFKGLEIATMVVDALLLVGVIHAVAEAATTAVRETVKKVSARAASEAAATAGSQAVRAGVNQTARAAGDAASLLATRTAREGSERAARSALDVRQLVELVRKAAASAKPKPLIGDKKLMYTISGIQAAGPAAQGLGKGVLDYQTTMALKDSEQDQAVVKMLGAVIDRFKEMFSGPQDLMQHLTESHSAGVDAAQELLRGQHQSMQNIQANLLR